METLTDLTNGLDSEALEQELKDMLAPLRAKRDDLVARREKLTAIYRETTASIDAQLRRLDQMMRVIEPKAAPEKPKLKKSTPTVSDAVMQQVFVALKQAGEPMTARQLHETRLSGRIHRTQVNNALTALRERGEIRLAGVTAPRNTRLYALPLGEED